MSKTLAVILNHNLPDETNSLFESLEPYQNDDYDLVVVENGCSENGKSNYSTYELNENIYWGGALNVMFQHVLNDTKYDSLLFLNNDIIVHGYNFVKTLRLEMFENDFKIVSPSIFQPTHDQGFWRQMHNWNSKTTRQVKWVDFNAPLIHRDLIENIRQFDSELIYGWGIDMLCGMKCEDMGWKVGVCDFVSILHLVAQTTKQGKCDLDFKDYCSKAEYNFVQYYVKHGLLNKRTEYMEHAQQYRRNKND
jgi:GT2 family glycosyltransferase